MQTPGVSSVHGAWGEVKEGWGGGWGWIVVNKGDSDRERKVARRLREDHAGPSETG